jgi:hypothetical protein
MARRAGRLARRPELSIEIMIVERNKRVGKADSRDLYDGSDS